MSRAKQLLNLCESDGFDFEQAYDVFSMMVDSGGDQPEISEMDRYIKETTHIYDKAMQLFHQVKALNDEGADMELFDVLGDTYHAMNKELANLKNWLEAGKKFKAHLQSGEPFTAKDIK